MPRRLRSASKLRRRAGSSRGRRSAGGSCGPRPASPRGRPRPASARADPRARGSRCRASAARGHRSPPLAAQEDLERQQGPERVPVVAAPGAGARRASRSTASATRCSLTRASRAERGCHVVAQVLAEPAVERHAEAALRPLRISRGSRSRDRRLEHALEAQAAGLAGRAAGASRTRPARCRGTGERTSRPWAMLIRSVFTSRSSSR